MKPEEIAAYIGASAWLPQITVWLYRYFIKPKLRVIPDQFASVGFTSLGPIFNVRMAFFVENADLIIDGIDLKIKHQDGDERTFQWAGIGETFSEITDSTGNKQIVSRDQTPIAIKVNTQSFLEKNVRFQEPSYHQMDKLVTESLVAHFNFLNQKSPGSLVADVLGSKEFFSVVEARKKWFWWKPGCYQVELKVSSPQKVIVSEPNFVFELSSVDIDLLTKNVETINMEITNVIKSNLPEAIPDQIVWQWATVKMRRSQGF